MFFSRQIAIALFGAAFFWGRTLPPNNNSSQQLSACFATSWALGAIVIKVFTYIRVSCEVDIWLASVDKPESFQETTSALIPANEVLLESGSTPETASEAWASISGPLHFMVRPLLIFRFQELFIVAGNPFQIKWL